MSGESKMNRVNSISDEIVSNMFNDIAEIKNTGKGLFGSEKTIQSLIDSITESIALIDKEGILIHTNGTFNKRHGSGSKDLTGENIFDERFVGVASNDREEIRKVFTKGTPVQIPAEYNGQYYKNNWFPALNTKGEVSHAALFSQDISEQKNIENAYKDSEERFRNVFENTASGMALVSLDGHYFLANKALCSTVGYSEAELSNMTIFEMTHPDDVPKELDKIQQLINGEIKNYQYEKRYIHKNGEIVWVLLTRSMVRDSKGEPFYFIGQVQDITFQKKIQEELKQASLFAEQAREQAEEARAKAELQSRTDYLTGILNRRAFMERLIDDANRVLRNNSTLTIILADIDYFKRINDTYGHKAGDEVLQAFSNNLDKLCRPFDFIGRYGGEEFVIGLPDISQGQGIQIAERMRTATLQMDIKIPGNQQSIKITASFGVATSTVTRISQAEKLIEKADTAMYKAKQNGRNRVEVFGSED